MARPLAENLSNRCQGTNQAGDRCGSPAVHGAQLCRAHLLGRNEIRKFDRAGDRLVKLTEAALDRLEQIIESGDDTTAERACRTVLDRTLPRPGPNAAVVVNLPGHGPAAAEDRLAPSEVVRQRLAALAAQAAERRAAVEAPPDEIVDAELVEDGGAA